MDFSPIIKSGSAGFLRSALKFAGLLNGYRKLTKVYLEPTSRCNLTCRMCMRHTWKEAPGDMSNETFTRFLASLDGFPSIGTVAFWGFGEPLLHPQIGEMIGQVARRSIRTEIITNGMLLDSDKADELIGAGLDMLVVSLDGACEQSQSISRKGSNLQSILDNLANYKTASQRLGRSVEIGIEFVLSKNNLSELGEIRPLARRIGASFVIVSNLLPYDESMQDDILYWLSTQNYTPPRLISGDPTLVVPTIDPVGKHFKEFKQAIPELGLNGHAKWSPTQVRGYCPFIERGSVSINKNGNVSPCIALMHDYRCFVLGMKKDVKQYAVGNIDEMSLSSIWNEKDFERFRKRVVDFDFSPCASCGGCEYFESNEQDCIGSPFPTCGGCLWAKGLMICP